MIKKPVASEIVYRGLLGEITKAVLPDTEADPMGVLASLMTMYSHAIGSKPYVAQGNIKHPLIIWTLLIGATSLGRKGTARRQASAVMEMTVPELADEDAGFIMDGCPESGAALVTGIKNLNDPNDPIWHENDGFPCLMIEEEWAKALMRGRMDKNFSVNLRKLWEGKSIQSITKKDGRITLPRPHVCITGHITPKEFAATMGAADLAGGTINRFMVFSVERSKLLPFGGDLDYDEIQHLTKKLKESIVTASKTGVIRMDPSARTHWATLYEELEALAGAGEDMEQFAGRAIPHVLRCAGIYALTTRGAVVVTRDDLEAATALMRYSIESVRYILQGEMGTDATASKTPLATRIWRTLEHGPQTASELRAAIGRNWTLDQIRSAVAEWRGDVVAYKNPASSGGRKGDIYCRLADLPADVVELLPWLDDALDPEWLAGMRGLVRGEGFPAVILKPSADADAAKHAAAPAKAAEVRPAAAGRPPVVTERVPPAKPKAVKAAAKPPANGNRFAGFKL
ncbi:DUF3987 domain-containing protein [Streptosporangium sp. NPDC020072]|uniref:DUF3987 domain-containing protein n=1 Tax=Streptosporangium sp. NPDC020072 TaxID=3154788 RepID=UPI0034266D3D